MGTGMIITLMTDVVNDSDDTIDKINYTKTVKRKNDKNEDWWVGLFDDEEVNLDAEVREVDS